MPTAYSNQRRGPGNTSAAPVAPSEDDEELPPQEAAPAAIPPPAPTSWDTAPRGTTGGIIPQQAGTWDAKPVATPRYNADPAQRAVDATNAAQENFAAQQRQMNPFIFSNDIHDLAKEGGQRQIQQAVRAADVGFNQQQMQDRRAEIGARRQKRADTAHLNSQDLAKYKSSGQQYYTDPESGRLTPILEEGTNKALFHQTPWAAGTDPDGNPTLMMRDRYGQRQFKSPPVVPSLDPTDDQMYYKMPDGSTQPAGSVDKFIDHPNYAIAKAARAAKTANIKAIHAQALEPIGLLRDQMAAQLDQAKQQVGEYDSQISSLTKLATDNEGTPLGEGYASQLAQLQERRDALNNRTKPKGDLAAMATRARGHYAVARATAMRDTFAAQEREIEARVKAAGGDLASDPAYIGNRQGLQAAEQAIQSGSTQMQQFESAVAPSSTPVGQPATPPTAEPVGVLQQSEPFAVSKQGVKSIGGVSIDSFAKRYGDGQGPVQPDALLRMSQRMKALDEMLVNPDTSLKPSLRDKVTEERNYLDSLYKQRFARLDPDAQKRVTEATRDPTLGEKLGGAAVGVARGAGTALADIGESIGRNAPKMVGNALLPGVGGVIADAAGTGKGSQYQENVALAAQGAREGAEGWKVSRNPRIESELRAGTATGTIPEAIGGVVPFLAGGEFAGAASKAIGLGERAGMLLSRIATTTAGAAQGGNSLRREAITHLSPELKAGKITQDQYNKAVGMAELAGSSIGGAAMELAPVAKFASRLSGLPAGKSFVSALLDKAAKGGSNSAMKWLAGGEGQSLLSSAIKEGSQQAGVGFAQSLATDLAAQKTFDPNRKVDAGKAIESAESMGVVGAILSAITRLASKPKSGETGAGKPTGPTGPKLTPEQQKAEDAFNAALNDPNSPLSATEKAHVEQLRKESEIVQEPTTPAQHSALAIHQGLKEQEKLRQSPEGAIALREDLSSQEKRVHDFYKARAEEDIKTKAGEVASGLKDNQVSGPTVKTDISDAANAAFEKLDALDKKHGVGKGATKERARQIDIIESERLAHEEANKQEEAPPKILAERAKQEPSSGTGSAPKEVAGNETESAPVPAQTAATEKSESITKAVANPDTEYQYTVQKGGEGYPGYVQVDAILPSAKDAASRNTVSSSVKDLNAAGAKLPEVPDWVPQGQYSKSELEALIKKGPPNDTNQAEPKTAGAPEAVVAPTAEKPAQEKAAAKEKLTVPPNETSAETTVPKENAAPVKSDAGAAKAKDAVREKVAPPAKAERPLDKANESQLINVAKELGIDPKGMSGDRLRARIESNAHPEDIADALKKPAKADIVDRLKAAKRSGKGGKLYNVTEGLFDAAHDAAIDIAILGIKAGRTAADVMKLVVQRFKAKFPDHTPEQLAKVEASVRKAIGEPEPSKSDASAGVKEPTAESPVAKSKSLAEKIGDKWKSFKDEKDLKQVIAATRDAVEGKANSYAAESKTEVSDALNRAEPDAKARVVADDALRFYIESGDGNSAQLAAMRAKVEKSTKADPKWKAKALAAIDYAEKNGGKLKDAATRYRRIMGEQLTAEQDAGLPTLEEKNYVPRHQDVEDGSWLEPKSGSASASGNRKNRSFDTTADSIAAGIDPRTLSATDSMTARVKAGMTGVNQRSWQKSLYDMKDPTTKEPVAVKPEQVKRADGSTYYQPPKGYDLESLGNSPTAVKKEYSGLVSALTDPSWFGKNKVTIAAQKVNANAKALTLAVDTFHLGRLAFRSAMINASHPQGFKLGSSYQKGLLLADHSPAEITRMAAAGDIPKENLKQYLEDKKTLDKLVSSGYNIGQVADAMHQEFIQSVPVLGDINKFIFQKFQRGAMTDAGILEFKRQKADNPKLSDAQVAQKVSRELMTRFGNLGRQGLFKSKTAQDIMRMLFLAPQWNEGLIRSELGGVKQIGQGVANLAQGKKASMGLLGREMLTTGASLFIASQLLNQATRGKFTWQNPEESWGAKMSAWIPDKLGGSSGFFLNPMGLAAETSHLMLNSFERSGNTFDPLIGYLRSRASSVTRPAWTFLTGQNSLGQTLKPSERWEKSAEDAIPAPISGGSIARVAKGLVSGGKTEKFPGEFQKQAMQSFGLRTDKAPTPEQRIYSLAHEYGKAHGKEDKPPGEISDYAELTAALRRGNGADAKAAIDTLLEKRSAADLEKYYRQWESRLFTGSHKTETDFLRTLTPEQRQQYAQARSERQRVGRLAFKALAGIPAGKRAGPFAPAPSP